MQQWIVMEQGYAPDRVELLGSKFTMGNGYFGVRGTLEEHGKKQLTAVTMSQIYDDSGNGWREIVNAPNPLYMRLYETGEEITGNADRVLEHVQSADLQHGIHARSTVFSLGNSGKLTLDARRFADINDEHRMVMRYALSADTHAEIELKAAIDLDIWELNGPHFENWDVKQQGNTITVYAKTREMGYGVAVAQTLRLSGNIVLSTCEGSERSYKLVLDKDEPVVVEVHAALCKSADCADPEAEAYRISAESANAGFDALEKQQAAAWEARWKDFDVEITGDDRARIALRHSIYLLTISAPFRTKGVAIPARGLSGQVYKGGMFWDTEMYFLQMFLHCAPEVARNLVMYRIINLQGAKDKAKEEGYTGAFYPWESQETGQEGCTYYNLTDIFTNRPVRTYFRDKQVHISAAVAHGILAYLETTSDESLLLEGGAETLLECAEFLFSYSHAKPAKDYRIELLDVTGPDEYHERVNNNAYTNWMTRRTAKGALTALENLKAHHPDAYAALEKSVEDFGDKLNHCRILAEKIYIPQPRESDGVIPQYDSFFAQEDCTLEELRSRIITPNEYLGSPTGLAVNTQIAKQADIVLLLTIADEYSDEIKRANWEYYEKRCEHGSSLSTCVYALLAAQLGNADWAYRYFLKAAELDLSGNYKLYLGPLYIGGTHPAANGGSWMVAVQGFGGLRLGNGYAQIDPFLPSEWKGLKYAFQYEGMHFSCAITEEKIMVTAAEDNKKAFAIRSGAEEKLCAPGQCIVFER